MNNVEYKKKTFGDLFKKKVAVNLKDDVVIEQDDSIHSDDINNT